MYISIIELAQHGFVWLPDLKVVCCPLCPSFRSYTKSKYVSSLRTKLSWFVEMELALAAA